MVYITHHLWTFLLRKQEVKLLENNSIIHLNSNVNNKNKKSKRKMDGESSKSTF